ncbi:MAG: phosphotransferase, partial [bacterium]|nr:phosphotransferase [bacterium]
MSAADDARISAAAKIANSVIWPGATVGPGADLENAIVGAGVTVNSRADGPVVRADDLSPHTPVRTVLRELKWDASSTVVIPLADRGSARAFTRLSRRRGRSAILVTYTDERSENSRYAGHAQFLASRGVSVPRVLLDLPSRGLCVLEDLGDTSLQDWVDSGADAGTLLRRYTSVIDTMLALHSVPLRYLEAHVGLEPEFDRALYAWERRLMADHFMRATLHIDQSTVTGVMADLRTVSRSLEALRPVLVHRDMQSSNVFFRGRKPVLIDFQGMRQGAAAYDVASLLCDPYVMLTPATQAVLLSYYLDRCRRRKEAR